MSGPGGIVSLPELGLLVYANYFSNTLVALSLADGTLVVSIDLPRPLYVAAGPPGSGDVCVAMLTGKYCVPSSHSLAVLRLQFCVVRNCQQGRAGPF